MNPTTSTRSYYPALDGLRGIAIILVICCHNLNFLPHFELGWVGVDLFFVLSGFLITDILLKAREEKNFLQNFFLRRILKIFPLYYGVLLVFFIAAPFFQGLAVQYQYYNQDQPMSWLHLQNWLYITHEKPTDLMPMGHFWSLSVEEQFYLFWPFIVFVVHSTRRLKHIVYTVLIVCIFSRLSSWLSFGNGYFNFHFQYMTRLDGLCIGSLIAIWRFSSYEQAKKNLLRLAAVVLSIQLILFIVSRTIFTPLPHFRFIGYTTIAALFGIIVYFAIEKRTVYSKLLLENSLMRYTGKISYGLYVYHMPVLVLFKIYLLDKVISYGYSYNSAYITISLAALAITVLMAMASYHFFEKKILVLKDIVTADGFFERAWRRVVLFFNPSSARQ